MLTNKERNIIKYCVISSTAELDQKAISLIPVSRKPYYWNRFLDQNMSWINKKEKQFEGLDKESKESLAVELCISAIYKLNSQIDK